MCQRGACHDAPGLLEALSGARAATPSRAAGGTSPWGIRASPRPHGSCRDCPRPPIRGHTPSESCSATRPRGKLRLGGHLVRRQIGKKAGLKPGRGGPAHNEVLPLCVQRGGCLADSGDHQAAAAARAFADGGRPPPNGRPTTTTRWRRRGPTSTPARPSSLRRGRRTLLLRGRTLRRPSQRRPRPTRCSTRPPCWTGGGWKLALEPSLPSTTCGRPWSRSRPAGRPRRRPEPARRPAPGPHL